MPSADRPPQYTKKFTAALQWMWGDGYLSPGGPEEVAQMLRDIDLSGRHVLDIGSGLGAIDVALIETFGASSVLGLDVEAQLIEHSRERVAAAKLADCIEFRLIEPGPLPLPDAFCDVVFSKDAIVHIPDKPAFYRDVLRVLEPGGVFVGSDWLRGGDETYTQAAREWLEVVHLDFKMQDMEHTRNALHDAGFERVRLIDRNAWYKAEITNELATLNGPRLEALAQLIGVEQAEHRRRSSALKQQVIEQGFLRPTHFVGYKPA